jgi:YHS domain-containing protein
MAAAKCKICGTKLDIKTAYKITDKNGKNKYFCSASEFEVEEARKKKAQEDKDRVYYLICDIMGEREIISTALYKEWQVWNKVADNAKIAKYLEENRDYLASVIARLGSSEYARIRYLSTIIRDKIKAFVPRVEVAEKPKIVVEEAIYEAPTQSLNKRRSLADLEDMF